MALSLGNVNLDDYTGAMPCFRLEDEGYTQGVATLPGDGRLPEREVDIVRVRAFANDADQLATLMQWLEAERKGAVAYAVDVTQGGPVFLQKQLPGESYATQALVTEVRFDVKKSPFSPPAPEGWGPIELAVTRHAYWESMSHTEVSATSIAYFCGTKTINSVPGDVNARVSLLRFAGQGSTQLDIMAPSRGIWVGIRSAGKHGSLDDFVPKWELEDGTMMTDASTQSDSTASGGTRVNVSFSSEEGWADRVIISLGDVMTHYTANYGRFLVLLRAKETMLPDQVSVKMCLRAAPTTDETNQVEYEEVEIKTDDWWLYPLGIITIPMVGRRRTLSGVSASANSIVIKARRIVNNYSDQLHLDCLGLIPVDEAWAAVVRGGGVAVPAATDRFEVGWNALDECTGLQHLSSSGTTRMLNPMGSSDGFGLMPGNNLLVLATERPLSSVEQSCLVRYYPRWSIMRGSET